MKSLLPIVRFKIYWLYQIKKSTCPNFFLELYIQRYETPKYLKHAIQWHSWLHQFFLIGKHLNFVSKHWLSAQQSLILPFINREKQNTIFVILNMFPYNTNNSNNIELVVFTFQWNSILTFVLTIKQIKTLLKIFLGNGISN